MTAKEYLSQIPRLKSCIKALEESYEQAQTMATKTTQRHDGIKVKSSGNRDSQEKLTLRMVELGNKIDSAVSELVQLQEEAIELVLMLNDPRERSVLIHRYVNGKSWVYVTCAIYQTTIDDVGIDNKIRQTHRIHARALKNFAKCHGMSC